MLVLLVVLAVAMEDAVVAAGAGLVVGSEALVKGFMLLSLVCRSSFIFLVLLHRHHGGGDGRHARWRVDSRRLGFAVCFQLSDRWVVFAAPATFLVEGRPCDAMDSSFSSIFTSWLEAIWRQHNIRLEAMALSYGNLVASSGLFHGDGEVNPDRRLRTQSCFLLNSGFSLQSPGTYL